MGQIKKEEKETTENKLYVDTEGNVKIYESNSNAVVYFRPVKWIDIGAKESKVLINKVDISDIEDGKVYQDIQYSQIIYKNNSKFQKSLDVLNEELKKEAEKFKNDNKDAIREYLPDYIKFMGTDGENAKYVYDSDISVSFENDNYISLTTNIYEFLLGAHGGTIIKCYTYDKKTGSKLTLDDFIKSRDDLKEFVKVWIKRESEKDDIFFPDAMDTVDTLLGENGSIEFCLNNIGLSIIFQQYDIAPYAYGIIEIPVDKQLLKDNLKF